MTNNIGFIGLGVLGSAVVQNLIQGGQKVIAYDISTDAQTIAAGLGAELAESPADVATKTKIIITCLPNANSLFEVLNGEHGILTIESNGQIIADMSTLSLEDKTVFQDACVASGRKPVDCPVSGNRIMALKKKLTAFFSGEKEDFELLNPVLKLTCGKTHFVGDFGNGTKVKLCGNILNLVHNSVAAEAMVLAMKSGLDPKMFHEVISGSGSSSAMFEVRGALMVDEDYQKEAMNLSVPLKDAKIISEHAASLFCPVPIYQTALQNYYAAAAQGNVDKDAASVCQVMERAANHTRQPQ